VISVGRADCIRSNIMQAHTGSLLECVRSLGSSPLSSPPHGRFAYTQNIRYSRYERTVLFVEIQYVCGFTLLSRRSRARESSLPTYMRARECTCVYVYIYIYIYIYTIHPTCIEIAGALNPGSGHEIVIPERLTLLPHLAGPRGRA